MTTERQAVDQLAKLHKTYCPLLDELIAAAKLAPRAVPSPDFAWWSSVGLSTDTNDRVIRDEQRQAELIWEFGKTAWGEVAGSRLMLMKATLDELREIADILKHSCLEEAHRAALIGCCVRSQRLSEYLAKSKVQKEPNKGKRCWALWLAMDAEFGPPPYRGKAERIREIANQESCEFNTAKKAINQRLKGIVPK